MSSIVSLSIDYNGKDYSILALIREHNDSIEFSVTIMNGELEKLLYGSHTFTWRKGTIVMSYRSEEPLQTLILKQQIAKVLEEYAYSRDFDK